MSASVSESRDTVEQAFRQESGRILASLIRACGDFDLAEEAMQEAFAVALQRWPADGVPRVPAAWITTTARRKAIDKLRRDQTLAAKQAELEADAALDAMAAAADPGRPHAADARWAYHARSRASVPCVRDDHGTAPSAR
jgi:RNA polymerase sigma-70 factor (ECF subfamily)